MRETTLTCCPSLRPSLDNQQEGGEAQPEQSGEAGGSDGGLYQGIVSHCLGPRVCVVDILTVPVAIVT